MKENIQNTANEALKGIIETASQIKQFSLEQIPDVLNQLLMYKLAESIAIIFVGIVLIIFSYIWFAKLANQKLEYGMWSESKTISSIIGCVASIFSLGFIIFAIFDILKITLAPKLYLIEYAARLIK